MNITKTEISPHIDLEVRVRLEPADQFVLDIDREGTFRIIQFRVVVHRQDDFQVMNGRGYLRRKDGSYNEGSERNAYVYWKDVPEPLKARIQVALKEDWAAHWMHKN